MIRKFCDRCTKDMAGWDEYLILAIDNRRLVVTAPEGAHYCPPCISELLSKRSPGERHPCPKCSLSHPRTSKCGEPFQ